MHQSSRELEFLQSRNIPQVPFDSFKFKCNKCHPSTVMNGCCSKASGVLFAQ